MDLKKKRSDVLKKVYEKLSALSDDELAARLRAHEEGDFARIIRDTGALVVGGITSEEYSKQLWKSDDSDLLPLEHKPLYFDLTLAVSSSRLSQIALFPENAEQIVSLGELNIYSQYRLPANKPLDFNQLSMWSYVYQESYIRPKQADIMLSNKGTSCSSDVAAGNDEDFCEWAKAA